MKFDDLVKMIVEADETQAPAIQARQVNPNNPNPQPISAGPKMAAKTTGGEEASTGKIYFCEIATKAIDNANKNKGKFPYMDRIIAEYADGINKLKSVGVGKINYSTLKKENKDGDTYEFVDALELPNGDKVPHWPIALSVEIDDENIQKQMGQKYKKMMLRDVASKEAGGGEAGKEAEDIATALG